MKRSALLFALAVLSTSCSSGSSGNATSLGDFIRGIISAETAIGVCESEYAPEYAGAIQELTPAWEATLLSRAQASIAAGRMTLDGVKATSCLAALAVDPATCWSASVSPTSLPRLGAYGGVLPAECLAAFAGAVDDHGSCYDDHECKSGRCNVNSCPGSCTPTASLGGSCAQLGCRPGLSCVAATCVSGGSAGANCYGTGDCAAGLTCDYSTCATPIASGGSCDPFATNTCADGFWCAPASGSAATGTCKPQVAANGACVGADAHSTNNSFEANSAECKGNQVCVGSVLDANGNATTQGHCDVPHDVGGACDASSNTFHGSGCYAGLVCVSGACALLPALGAPCPGGACDPNTAWCSNGVCAALKANGEVCNASGQCSSRDCNSDSAICVAPPVECREP
jgi:hypothetical protein